MTTKELLYVEDALGHAKYFQNQVPGNRRPNPEMRI